MKRVVIVGCSGAGKTTLARTLAEQHGLDHIELDSIFHQAGWQPLEASEFQRQLTARIDAAPDGWVTCGNYNSDTDGVHVARADTVVWIDLPRSLVIRRVVTRTVRRALTREELWNGNTEPISNFTRWDPEKNIIRWTWVKWPNYRATFEAKLTDGSWDRLAVHRLTTEAEVDAFVAEHAPAVSA